MHCTDERPHERRVPDAEPEPEWNGDEGGCHAELALFVTDSAFQIPRIHAIFVLAIEPTTRDLLGEP